MAEMLNNRMALSDGSLEIGEYSLKFNDKSKRKRILLLIMFCVWPIYGAELVYRSYYEHDRFYLAFGFILILVNFLGIYRLVKEYRKSEIAFAEINSVSLYQFPNGKTMGKIVTTDKKVKRFTLDTGYGNLIEFITLLEGQSITVKAKLR